MPSLLIVLLMLSAPSVAGAFDVTACGQTIPVGTVGRLVADLTCDPGVGIGPAAVLLSPGSTLDLAGYTLNPGSMNTGVRNARPTGARVRVIGPGVITGGAHGIEIVGSPQLRLTNLTIADNAVGVVGRRVAITNVTMTGNTVSALQGSVVDADGLVVDANPGQGIGAGRIHGRDVTVRDNGTWGIYASDRAVFESLTASGNGLVGLRCDRCRPRLKASTLTGNDITEIGIDLQSPQKPRLKNTACGKSLGLGTGPWGVCVDD